MPTFGKRFTLGNPYLHPEGHGIYATWPSGDMTEFRESFEDAGEILQQQLRCRAHAQSLMFKLSHAANATTTVTPIQTSKNFIVGAGGASFEFGAIAKDRVAFFRHFKTDLQQVLGFNLVADLYEFLDMGMKAPRIESNDGRKFRLEYPLLLGTTRLPSDTFTSLARTLCNEVGFEIIRDSDKICNEERRQTIYTRGRRIKVENGYVLGEDFNLQDITKASYVIAKLADSAYMTPVLKS